MRLFAADVSGGRASSRVRAVIALCLAALAVLASGAAGASTASCLGSAKPPQVGTGNNFLTALAAPSACDVWAVGYRSKSNALETLAERWNGKAWKLEPSANLGTGSNQLESVASSSPNEAWAAGYYFDGHHHQTLIEHWNGKAWVVQPSPDPGGPANNYLYGVAATSAKDAWAVGDYDNGTVYQTLIEHWDGSAWQVQASPNPGGSASTNQLEGAVAISSSDAWAVGYYFNGSAYETLIEHWNGTAWQVQVSPNPGRVSGLNYLYAVAATSAKDAWAVGYYYSGDVRQTLIEHWNGKTWKVQKSPDPSTTDNVLLGVAAHSSGDAWAAGLELHGSVARTLVEHWNGRTWKVQPSPSPSTGENELFGVAAISSSDAWTAGYYFNGTKDRALIEHWNGKAWKG